MNTLLRGSVAATLAFAGATFAQPAAEQDPTAEEHPAQSVTFGVRNSLEAARDPAADAAESGAAATDGGTTGQSGFVGSESFTDPAERAPPQSLNNPARRAAARDAVRQAHPDLATALGIDTATAEKLIDLLTAYRLRQAATGQRVMHSAADLLLQAADAEAERLDALRALLGEQGLERYVDYSATLSERMQVSMFEARLPAGHKLVPLQKEQMIALYEEDSARHWSELRDRRSLGGRNTFFPGAQAGELQRAARLATIAANEEHWRALPQRHTWLSQRAAEFLSTPQLAALTQAHAETENGLRQWIEKARLDAGLDPAIPDASQLADVGRAQLPEPLAGQVKIELELTVNRNEPIIAKRVASNGQSVLFEAGADLLVAATPTLYDDGSLDVQFAYYEQRGARRRHLVDVMTISTGATRPADAAGVENATVSTGIKAYAIKANVKVVAL